MLPLAVIVADDRDFRSGCRGALAAAGYRLATPTTVEGAGYFLSGSAPPDVVVFAARERWEALLADGIRRASRPVAVVVLEPAQAKDVVGAVRAAVEPPPDGDRGPAAPPAPPRATEEPA